MKHEPQAHLFINGNATYFDENEQQIPKMQQWGWSGLHLFHAAYPEAKANICCAELDIDCIEYLLRNIIHPKDRTLIK